MRTVARISGCHYETVVYNNQVRLLAKFLALGLVAGCALLGSGCSGINTGATVSPASFFLPGLLRADPAPAGRHLPVAPQPMVIVAQVR